MKTMQAPKERYVAISIDGCKVEGVNAITAEASLMKQTTSRLIRVYRVTSGTEYRVNWMNSSIEPVGGGTVELVSDTGTESDW